MFCNVVDLIVHVSKLTGFEMNKVSLIKKDTLPSGKHILIFYVCETNEVENIVHLLCKIKLSSIFLRKHN